MDQALPAIGLMVFAYALLNWIKRLTGKDWWAALTLLLAWAGGVVAVILYAQSDWAVGEVINDVPLDQLNTASQVIAGIMIGSGASVIFDGLRAFNRSDEAVQPSLGPEATSTGE